MQSSQLMPDGLTWIFFLTVQSNLNLKERKTEKEKKVKDIQAKYYQFL